MCLFILLFIFVFLINAGLYYFAFFMGRRYERENPQAPDPRSPNGTA